MAYGQATRGTAGRAKTVVNIGGHLFLAAVQPGMNGRRKR